MIFKFLLFFIPSFAITVALMPPLKKFGSRFKLFDDPAGDDLKIHRKPVAYIGGLVIFLGFLSGFLLFALSGMISGTQFFGIVFGGLLTICFGFWDDVKWKKTARPIAKLALLLATGFVAALIANSAGIGFNSWAGQLFGTLLAGFYIIGAMTSINMEDGADGLAGGEVAVSLAGFVFLSLVLGNIFFFALSVCLLAAVIGFLLFNWNPATVFMGDSGSHFLGFILAVLAIGFSASPFLSAGQFAGPVFIIGLPVFDTAIAIVRRVAAGRSPFLGDRGHLYDILLKKGLSVKQTVFACCIIQAVMVILGIAIYL